MPIAVGAESSLFHSAGRRRISRSEQGHRSDARLLLPDVVWISCGEAPCHWTGRNLEHRSQNPARHCMAGPRHRLKFSSTANAVRPAQLHAITKHTQLKWGTPE